MIVWWLGRSWELGEMGHYSRQMERGILCIETIRCWGRWYGEIRKRVENVHSSGEGVGKAGRESWLSFWKRVRRCKIAWTAPRLQNWWFLYRERVYGEWKEAHKTLERDFGIRYNEGRIPSWLKMARDRGMWQFDSIDFESWQDLLAWKQLSPSDERDRR